jgi:uncharacterized protein (TIGR03663 family)
VSTASTRQQSKKQGRGKGSGSVPKKGTVPQPAPAGDISDRTWFTASVVIVAVAAFLRLYDLNLVPLHHDEGVNGNFLVTLVREGRYHYDPANYHGPTLYYFSAIVPWILRFLFGPAAQNNYGLTTFMIRLVPALFGLATILLIFLLRRRLGSVGTLGAGTLLAISPGAVYLSRYYIHETLFVFFTFAIVVAALKFYEEGHAVYLILASISAALLFATKETAFVSAAVLIIAFVSTHIYRHLTGATKGVQRIRDGFATLLERVGGPAPLMIWLIVAVVVFLGINLLFYSSFFKNYPKGVTDALKTFEIWSKTGKQAHVHPPTTYILWLMRQESPLLILGTIGALIVVLKPRNSFALFSALWAFGLIAAYSLIAYKTPWLILNFIVPLALIGGYTLQFVYRLRWARLKAVLAVGILAIAISGYQTIDLNFFNYDNDDEYYVYVYAHTRRGLTKLVQQVDDIAKKSQGTTTGITIVSPDYWPLPWYFRDYSRVGYYGRMADSTEPLIIASEGQRTEIRQKFGSIYKEVPSGLNEAGNYPLRPGVNLLLFMRRDSAKSGP